MAIEYSATLDYNESFSINEDIAFIYAEFEYTRKATYGSRELRMRYLNTPNSYEGYLQVTFGTGDNVRMMIPFTTEFYSADMAYFAGMKWTIEIDYDNSQVIVNNPVGGTEIMTLRLDRIPDHIYELSATDNGKGTVYINDFGTGIVWEDDISLPDGGGGDADTSTDTVGVPTLPTISALTSSMIRMYNPDIPQLTALAGFLWSSTFTGAVVSLFQDPMETIVGLSMVYVSPTVGTAQTMLIGKVSSGISALPVTNQFVTLDCGTINVNEYWGNALDYEPHTKMQIYLPYIGVQTISADDIMRGTLGVKYNIDLLTGACMCFLTVNRDSLNSVLYSFSGNVSAQIPLSGRDMSSVVSSIVGIVASAGLTVATGGASAPLVAGSAMSMLNSKQHIQKSGRLDSAVGVLGIKKPYLIITRPIQSLAENYNSYRGYPSNITKQLNDLTGYTEVETVYMKGITATEDEIDLIERRLKEGVIL